MRKQHEAMLASAVRISALLVLMMSAIITPASTGTAASNRTAALITDLDMVSASSGWVWGANLVGHTSNGARTVTDVTPAGIARVGSVAVLDTHRAWVLGTNSSIPDAVVVFRTDDGGLHWAPNRLKGIHPYALTFVDRFHGWMESVQLMANHRVNRLSILATSDGGKTWSVVSRARQRISIQPNVQKGDCQWSLPRFVTPQLGFIGLGYDKTGIPKIDRTEDGGHTWHRLALPRLPHRHGADWFSTVTQPVFASPTRGAAFVTVCQGSGTFCYDYGTVCRTRDGGRTWSVGTEVRGSGSFILPDARHVWLFSLPAPQQSHTLLQSADAGQHWRRIRVPREVANRDRQFDFVSPSTGFEVMSPGGFSAVESYYHYYRTTDGGKTFTRFVPYITRLK